MRTFTILALLALAIAPASAHADNKVFIVGPATAKPDLPGSVALATSPDAEIASVQWLICRTRCVERPGVEDPFGLAEQTGLVFGYLVKKANVGALLRV